MNYLIHYPDGAACFVCDLGEVNGTVYEFENEDESKAPCLTCGVMLDLLKLPKVLEHNSAHVLHDTKIARDDNICCFCLRSASQCTIKLQKTPGSNYQVDFEQSSHASA